MNDTVILRLLICYTDGDEEPMRLQRLLQVQLLHLKRPYMTSYLGRLGFSVKPVAYSSDFFLLLYFMGNGTAVGILDQGGTGGEPHVQPGAEEARDRDLHQIRP